MKRATTNLEQGRILGKVVLIVVIVAVLGTGGWFLFAQDGTTESDGREAADQFVSLVASDDAAGSYAMYTDESKAQIPEDLWRSLLEITEIEGKPIFVEEVPVQEPAATYGEGVPVVRYVYSFRIEGASYQASIVLIQKDGQWKISEMSGFTQ